MTVQNQAGTNTGNVTLPAATISGVETFNIRALSTTAADTLTVAASNYTGVTAVNADRSINKVAVTGLAAGASAGMIGNGSVLNGALDLAYATATSAVTLNISGGTLNTANAAKIAVTTGSATSATINSTGSAANAVDTVALSSANTVTALTINADARLTTGVISGFAAATTATAPTNTVTVSGSAAGSATAAAVTIGALDGSVGTVTASGLTAGGVSFTMNATPTTFAFTGGAGQDIVTTAAAYVAANNVSINAGAGTSDRLVVANSAHIDAASAAKYSNFEQLQVSNGVSVAANLLATNNNISAIRINDGAGNTGVTSLTAAQAGAVSIIGTGQAAAGGSGITIDITGASGVQTDTVTAAVTTVTSLGAAQNAYLNGITLTGIENLVLNASATSSSAAGTLIFDTANATALGSITVSNVGTSILDVGAATGTNLRVDASGSSGAATIFARNYSTTTGAALTGGSGNDTIYGTDKADVLVGGAGDDAMYVDKATAGTKEIQILTFTTNNATANAKWTIGGVDVAITDTSTPTQTASAIVAAANSIMAVNPNIESIASALGVVTITYRVTAGDVANISATTTSAAQTGAFGGGATAAGVLPTHEGGTAHAAADTVTGGAGNDTFYFTPGGAVTVAATITDLNLGGSTQAGRVDQINIDGATTSAGTPVAVVTLTSAQQSNVTAAATLAAAVDIVLGIASTVNNVAQFTYGSDTYFIHNGVSATAAYTAGEDTLIKITGVTGTLDASDITIV